MKKALIISLAPHNTLGGTQNYNNKLIKILQELDFVIDEYNCNLGMDKENGPIIAGVNLIHNSSVLSPSSTKMSEGRKFFKQVKFSDIEISRLIKNNNYNLIIDSRQHPIWTKKKYKNDFLNNENCIWVQHFPPGIYEGEYITNKFFTIFTKLFMSDKKNVLYNHSNIVLFDKFNLEKLNPKKIKDKNITLIPLAHTVDTNNMIEFNKRKINLAYIGRIEQHQKNFGFLIKSSKFIEEKINVWGHGSFLSKIQDIMICHGFIEQNKINFIMQDIKFILMCSKWEGFPFILVQAISNGVIPIVIDTYPSAKFLTTYGFNFKASIKPKEFASEVNKILKMDEKYLLDLSAKNIQFAKDNLTDEKFAQSWKENIKKHTSI